VAQRCQGFVVRGGARLRQSRQSTRSMCEHMIGPSTSERPCPTCARAGERRRPFGLGMRSTPRDGDGGEGSKPHSDVDLKKVAARGIRCGCCKIPPSVSWVPREIYDRRRRDARSFPSRMCEASVLLWRRGRGLARG